MCRRALPQLDCSAITAYFGGQSELPGVIACLHAESAKSVSVFCEGGKQRSLPSGAVSNGQPSCRSVSYQMPARYSFDPSSPVLNFTLRREPFVGSALALGTGSTSPPPPSPLLLGCVPPCSAALQAASAT